MKSNGVSLKKKKSVFLDMDVFLYDGSVKPIKKRPIQKETTKYTVTQIGSGETPWVFTRDTQDEK